MKKLECQYCDNYIQHYIKENKTFKPIYCGSCILNCRVSTVLCCQKACENFKEKKTVNCGLSFLDISIYS